MGKGDFLKIGFQLNQNVLNKDKQKGTNQQRDKRKAMQTNENYQQEVVDIKAVFIIPNARVVAEDIIAYIQVNLLELTKSKEYIEIVKPQIADFLALDSSQLLNKSTEMEGQEKSHSTTSGLLQKLKVNDDLLLGNVDFKDIDAQKLKDMAAKSASQFDSSKQHSQLSLGLEQSETIQAASDSDSDEELNDGEDADGNRRYRRPMTSA